MNTVIFRLEGMHCTGCAETIRTLLERTAGVRKAIVSFDQGEARILYDPQATSEAQLVAAIGKAGYQATKL